MSNELPQNQFDEETMERVKKRNRVVGLSLAAFVVALGVISYFRIKGLTP